VSPGFAFQKPPNLGRGRGSPVRCFAATSSAFDVGLDPGSRGTICRFQRQHFLAHAFDGYRARWRTFVLREVSDGKLKGTCSARSYVRGASRKSDRSNIPATLPGNGCPLSSAFSRTQGRGGRTSGRGPLDRGTGAPLWRGRHRCIGIGSRPKPGPVRPVPLGLIWRLVPNGKMLWPTITIRCPLMTSSPGRATQRLLRPPTATVM
jgi:hypothetical protein